MVPYLQVSFYSYGSFTCLSNFAASCLSSTPLNFFFVAIYMYLSFKIQRYYMNVKREVTRLKAIASSPTIQAFKEEVEGIATIKDFSTYKKLFLDYLYKVDELQKGVIVETAAEEWFEITVSLLSLMVIIPCILTSVNYFLITFSYSLLLLRLEFSDSC